MSTLHRVSYIDRRGFVTHEWFPTLFTANDRVNELVTLGMESVDFEEVEVPWDHLADLIHWLNRTPNSPNLKDSPMYGVLQAAAVASQITPAPKEPGHAWSQLAADLDAVDAEVTHARTKWPQFNSAHEGFAVLLEEVDELKTHVWTNQKRRDLAAMRKEAMQVAAMALRFMSECCDEATGRK